MPNFPYTPGNDGAIKGFDLLADYMWPHRPSGKTHFVESDESPEQTSFGHPASESEPANDSAPGTGTPNIISTDSFNASNTFVPPEPDSKAPTEFLMFLGDFIYVDVPHYFGDLQETYRRLYRRNYASHSFRKIYEKLRACTFKHVMMK